MDLSKYIISINASVIDVLKKIDSLPIIQTVFVVNEYSKVVGTITDGDIRRGLIVGLSIEDSLDSFVFKKFRYLIDGEKDFEQIKNFRDRRLKAVPLLSKEGILISIIDFSKTKSILPVDAVIMAGGLGSRLRPLTNETPKPLLKVGGKEIISYNFDRLSQFGINNQFITVNYLGEQLEDYCSTYNKDINFSIVNETEFLGTAGSMSLIDINDFENDTILLMNSDLLTNIDYEDFYKTFIQKGADILVASIPYQVNLPYAIFEEEDRKISSFKEKPNYTYYANAGIYIIKKELLKLIPQGKVYNATDLMEDVIKSSKSLIHYPIRQYWLDIGKHEDFEKAQKDIAHINWD